MAKKSNPKNGASDDARQKALELAPANPAPTVSKAEAVRRAIGAGVESPSEGVAYVMKHFGIEMDNKTFSLNRSQQRAREARLMLTRGRPGRRPRTGGPATPTAAATRTRGGDIISDIESVKELIDKHGKDGLKRLVDALG